MVLGTDHSWWKWIDKHCKIAPVIEIWRSRPKVWTLHTLKIESFRKMKHVLESVRRRRFALSNTISYVALEIISISVEYDYQHSSREVMDRRITDDILVREKLQYAMKYPEYFVLVNRNVERKRICTRIVHRIVARRLWTVVLASLSQLFMKEIRHKNSFASN